MKAIDELVNEAFSQELDQVGTEPVDEKAVLQKTLQKLGMAEQPDVWYEPNPDFEPLDPEKLIYLEPERPKRRGWQAAAGIVAACLVCAFTLFAVAPSTVDAIPGLGRLFQAANQGMGDGYNDQNLEWIQAHMQNVTDCVSTTQEGDLLFTVKEAYYDGKYLYCVAQIETAQDPNGEGVEWGYRMKINGADVDFDYTNSEKPWVQTGENTYVNDGISFPIPADFRPEEPGDIKVEYQAEFYTLLDLALEGDGERATKLQVELSSEKGEDGDTSIALEPGTASGSTSWTLGMGEDVGPHVTVEPDTTRIVEWNLKTPEGRIARVQARTDETTKGVKWDIKDITAVDSPDEEGGDFRIQAKATPVVLGRATASFTAPYDPDGLITVRTEAEESGVRLLSFTASPAGTEMIVDVPDRDSSWSAGVGLKSGGRVTMNSSSGFASAFEEGRSTLMVSGESVPYGEKAVVVSVTRDGQPAATFEVDLEQETVTAGGETFAETEQAKQDAAKAEDVPRQWREDFENGLIEREKEAAEQARKEALEQARKEALEQARKEMEEKLAEAQKKVWEVDVAEGVESVGLRCDATGAKTDRAEVVDLTLNEDLTIATAVVRVLPEDPDDDAELKKYSLRLLNSDGVAAESTGTQRNRSGGESALLHCDFATGISTEDDLEGKSLTLQVLYGDLGEEFVIAQFDVDLTQKTVEVFDAGFVSEPAE